MAKERQIDFSKIKVEYHKDIIVGSGIAGLSAANSLGECTLVTAGKIGKSGSTIWAQGGIAAAVGGNDSSKLHSDDTLDVSAGLADASVVNAIVSGGSAAIEKLIELGAEFDLDSSEELSLGIEAGHSVRRIVKSNGDAIGKQLIGVLSKAVLSNPKIKLIQNTKVIELAMDSKSKKVIGVLTKSETAKKRPVYKLLVSRSVVLATGGFSYLYKKTTNPSGSIGYGVYLAGSVGADLIDMEFVQFHPTALDVEGTEQLPLLTEALRGEGAILKNSAGERFMNKYSSDLELAPRDIVARAIYDQISLGMKPCLVTEGIVDNFEEEFPTVSDLISPYGYEAGKDELPVTPAAHYCMGGIKADSNGKTSVPGLWALGEVSSTGLHGANRLASNSLLEGFVMGVNAAKSINSETTDDSDSVVSLVFSGSYIDQSEAGDLQEMTIRRLMWEKVGVIRSGIDLMSAKVSFKAIAGSGFETYRVKVMHFVASQVIQAAMSRTETRGAHSRAESINSSNRAGRRIIQVQKPLARSQYMIEKNLLTEVIDAEPELV